MVLDLKLLTHLKGSGAAASMAYAISYTGVEGLTLDYATGEDDSTAGNRSLILQLSKRLMLMVH